MSDPAEYKIIIDSPDDDPRERLAQVSGLSTGVVAEAMASGAVWLRNQHGTRRLRRRSARVAKGDELFLNYDQKVLAQTVAPAELIQDGGRWSVWLKPFGMRSQGSRWGDHTTLGRFAEQNLDPQRDSFIVHRLDMAASGIMLLAHDKKAAAHLSAQFASRTVGKTYYAVVHGKFPNPGRPTTYERDIDGKIALTDVERMSFDPDKNRSVVKVRIMTGRKHQIRRHLADAGFPIVGDRLYGTAPDEEDLCLTASALSFVDPVTEERIKIERLPDEWL